MGHSSLLGTERAAEVPAGRDNAALGPGDSSDSGSDLVGLGEREHEDPNVPVDVALRDEASRSVMPPDAAGGTASDAAGTGERRSAGGDAGREGADISVDHVFSPDGEPVSEAEDADLAFVDEAADEAQRGFDEDDGIPGSEPDPELDLENDPANGDRQPARKPGDKARQG